MRRVIAAVVAATGLAAASVLSAQAIGTVTDGCGTSMQAGHDDFTFRAETCPEPTTRRGTGQPQTPRGDTSQQPVDSSTTPTRRTVSKERWYELFDNCRRGPDRDALSITCVAALPDRAEDPSDDGTQRPAPMTTQQVREVAIARLDLGRPQVGASPCLASSGPCRGTVGLPVWLWVDEGDGQLPSDSASASAGPFSISAKAEVVKVKWSLGDGQTTVCSGTGSAYDPDTDGWSTPTCGFRHGWQKAGTYTLTATYVWRVSWSGDETGSQTQEMSSTREVTIGELQSLVTGH